MRVGSPLAPDRLGATLYVPATRPDLLAVAEGGRVPNLRSMVVCLEDSLGAADVAAGLANVRSLLRSRSSCAGARPLLFLRPRSAEMLGHVMQMTGAERLDGVVAPKATTANLDSYLRAAGDCGPPLMPTLETIDVFDPVSLRRLRRVLERFRDRILMLRIGGADLHQLLRTRRSRVRTIYDGPLGPVIANLVATFVPAGFALSAPLFEAICEPDLLREEVERDLEHGLVTKTAIHPSQVEVIQSVYTVASGEVDAARAILNPNGRAVFQANGAMCETATHGAWARDVLARQSLFGAREDVA